MTHSGDVFFNSQFKKDFFTPFSKGGSDMNHNGGINSHNMDFPIRFYGNASWKNVGLFRSSRTKKKL